MEKRVADSKGPVWPYIGQPWKRGDSFASLAIQSLSVLAEASCERGECNLHHLASQGMTSPRKNSQGRWGHSFPSLAPQTMSSPFEVSH